MLLANRQEPYPTGLKYLSHPPFDGHDSSLFSDSYHQITHQVVSNLSAFEDLNLAQNHLLIQGSQGSGKTRLLKQIQQRLLTEKNVIQAQKHLSVIRLNEHEYGIRTVRGLCQCLSEHIPATAQDPSFILPSSHKNTTQDSPSNHWSHFIAQLQETQTRLFIMVDNIDCLLKQLDKVDYDFIVKKIFNVKQTHYRLIATHTVSAFTSTSSLNAFTPILIPSLDKNSAHHFLQNKIEESPSTGQSHAELALSLNANKLETVRLFTQANAKTLTHFYQAFLQDPNATSYQYLAYILAQYQSPFSFHIQRLSAQQQVIVHALGSHWHASQVANLTKTTHLPSKTISAQLTQLEKQKVIVKVPSTNKNHYYRLTDRLFHLWYLFSFANQKAQNSLRQSVHIMSYLTWETPYKNSAHDSDRKNSNLCRSRLESRRYNTALSVNDDVKTEALNHLFIHALDFVLSMKNKEEHKPINGQNYCESASQYFKEQLPGERLTFLLNAACRGYEQAYLGLISLFDLADTPAQMVLAYQINSALYRRAHHQGYDVSSRLLSLYLSQGVMSADSLKLAQRLSAVEEQDQFTLLLQSFTALWNGQADSAKQMLNRFLEQADLSTLEPIVFEWLVELLILLMSQQEWEYLTQVFSLYDQSGEANKTLKGQFLVLYYGLLTLKPKLSDKEVNEIIAMPPELKESMRTLINCVTLTGEKYG